MSLIHEFRETENALQQLQARLAQIQNDERFQRERAFEQQLRELLGNYGKSLRDVIDIIDPAASRKPEIREPVRRQRRLKTYKNPHTGEVIQTKGGNHNQLKQWKAEYGADQVESWASMPD